MHHIAIGIVLFTVIIAVLAALICIGCATLDGVIEPDHSTQPNGLGDTPIDAEHPATGAALDAVHVSAVTKGERS